jgi:hypothetical protein
MAQPPGSGFLHLVQLMIIRNNATVSHDIDPLFAVSLIIYSHVFYQEICALLILSFHLHLEAILPTLGH